eukprot:11980_1
MGPKYVRFMFRKKQLERLEYKTGCSNSSSYKKRLRGDKVPHLFRYSCSKSIHFPKSSLSDVDNPNELLSPLSLEREEQGVMVMSHKRQKLNPGRSMIAISSEQTQIRDQANEEKSVELGQKGEVYAESLMEDGELSGERDDNGFTMDLSESVSDSAKDNVQSGERDDNGFTMDLSESVSDGAKDNVQSGERDVNVVSMELSESSVDGAKVDAQKTKPASAPMPESKNVRKPPKAIRIVDAETVQILHKLQGVLSTKSGKLMQYKDVVRTLAVQWAGSKKKLNSLLEDWDRFVVRHPEYFDDRLKDLEPIGKTSSLSMSTSQPTSRDRVRTVFRQTFSPTSPPNSQPNSQPTFRQGHKPTSQPAVRPVSRRAETQLGSIQSGSTKLPSSDSLKFTLGASTGISTNFTSQSVGISTSKSVSVSARRHASVSARNQTGPSVRTQPSISATGHVSVLPRIQARISVGRKASCSSSSGVSVSSRGQSSVSARSQADVSVRSQTSISGTGHGSASPRSQTNISVRCQVGVLSSRDGSVSARRCSANVSSSDSIGTQIPGDKESPIDFAEEKEFDKPSKSSSTRKRRPSKKRASSKCESATKKRPHYKKKKKTWSGKCKEGYKESPKINL